MSTRGTAGKPNPFKHTPHLVGGPYGCAAGKELPDSLHVLLPAGAQERREALLHSWAAAARQVSAREGRG